MDEVERLETKKQERSKAKMAVTRAARRLMGATYRNVDFEALKGLSVELENVYDDFCVTSEEYELLVTDEKFAEHQVVNGDDLKTYNANVKQTYEEARDVYIQLKCENDKSQQTVTMAPLTTAIKRDMSRLKIIISAVEDNLSKETPNYDSLHMDRGDMEKLLDEICDKVARLTVIQQDTQLQDDVEVIIESAYNTLRNANLCLWSKQNPKVAVTLLNDNLSATNTESISSTMTTSGVSHTQTQASSSTSPTSNPLNFQPMEVPPVSAPAPTVYSTMAISPQQYNPVSCLPMVSSAPLPIGQPATSPTSNPLNFQPFEVPPVSAPAPTVYSTMAISPQQYNPVSSLPMVSSAPLPIGQPATSPTSNPLNFQPMEVPPVSAPAPTVYSTMAISPQQYNPVSSLPMVSSAPLPIGLPATSPTSNLLNFQPLEVPTMNPPAPTVYSTTAITPQQYYPVNSLPMVNSVHLPATSPTSIIPQPPGSATSTTTSLGLINLANSSSTNPTSGLNTFV